MIKRFDIIWVNLDPTIGREIKKTRPCLVISPNELNEKLDTVIVAPITSTIKNWPFRLTIKLNNNASSVAFDRIRSISKIRIEKLVERLSDTDKRKVFDILEAIFSE